MIKVRIEARFGKEVDLEGEPINKLYADLEFTHEDMAGDQIQVMEALKLSWAALRSQYMTRTQGPKWYLDALMKKHQRHDNGRTS